MEFFLGAPKKQCVLERDSDSSFLLYFRSGAVQQNRVSCQKRDETKGCATSKQERLAAALDPVLGLARCQQTGDFLLSPSVFHLFLVRTFLLYAPDVELALLLCW